MIFVSRVLHYGKSPISGVIYTREMLQELVTHWESNPDKPIFGYVGEIKMDNYNRLELENIATKIIKLELDDEGLVVHQEFLKTPKGIWLLEYLNLLEAEGFDTVNLKITPNMIGKLDNGYNATELKCLGVNFGLFVNPPMNQKK